MQIEVFKATVDDTYEKIETIKNRLETQLEEAPGDRDLEQDLLLFKNMLRQAEELKHITRKYLKSNS